VRPKSLLHVRDLPACADINAQRDANLARNVEIISREIAQAIEIKGRAA
jgi:hypothetical protein